MIGLIAPLIFGLREYHLHYENIHVRIPSLVYRSG